MKITALILFLHLISNNFLLENTCVIKCQELNTNNKIPAKGIPFSLIIKTGPKKELALSSNQNGVLIIDKVLYAKIKNELISSFHFLNPSDHEYYGTPYQLYNKKVKLSEICGKTLAVDRIW